MGPKPKTPNTMLLTVDELEAVRDEAAEGARKKALAESGQRFDVEEMQAVREQYEEQLSVERDRREDLEWRLRLALARLRDVESATDKLRAIQDSLRGVLTEVEEKPAPPPIPGQRVTPPAVPARAMRKDGRRFLA